MVGPPTHHRCLSLPAINAPIIGRRPSVISLYSGAGGLDYGLEAAGFDIAVANDSDHDSCETLRRNRNHAVIERSIFEMSSALLLDVAGLQVSDADLLVGGPPCQPFSKSGYWARGDTKRLLDPRADTLSAYLRVLEESLPRVFVIENVEGLSYRGKTEGLSYILASIREINERTGTNYRPVCQVLSAAELGVPQIRKRLFIIGARDGREFRFPTKLSDLDPSETSERAIGGSRFYRTAWDAIGDLDADESEDLSLRGKWSSLLPSIPEGKNYLWHTERGDGLPIFGWRRRYWGFLLKLAKSQPSWTIQAQPGPAIGPFHWNNRRLSTLELCRIQTFPDDIRVVGNRMSVQRQIGNAVPSLLMEIIAREIRKQLLDLPDLDIPLRLLPARREPVPRPAPTCDVPREFLGMVGKHSPHPGTGRGNAALARESRLPLPMPVGA
jgi:DNA (cytosine-5)-methyltransferase 1